MNRMRNERGCKHSLYCNSQNQIGSCWGIRNWWIGLNFQNHLPTAKCFDGSSPTASKNKTKNWGDPRITCDLQITCTDHSQLRRNTNWPPNWAFPKSALIMRNALWVTINSIEKQNAELGDPKITSNSPITSMDHSQLHRKYKLGISEIASNLPIPFCGSSSSP